MREFYFSSMNTNLNTPVVIGRVGAVHGVTGWIKIISFTEPPENILNYTPWYLNFNGQWQTVKLLDKRFHHHQLLALFEDHSNREIARKLTGMEIAIDRSQLPQLATGEYYWSDLEGLTVTNLQNNILGKVAYLMETGANDILVVTGDRRRLIPFIPKQVIIDINLADKHLLVDWDADF